MASTRVYIGRLPYKARERDVEDFFRGFGRIREILLKSGFGFVEFDDPRDADDAVYSLNGRELCGERVIVEMTKRPPKGRDAYRSTYRSTRYSGRSPERRRRDREDKYGPPAQTPWRCIVRNLSSRISWQDLKDFMRQAGEVTYADAHRAARNEGVVCFTSHSELKKAIDTLDGKVLNGRRIKLTDGSRGKSRSYSSSRSKSSGSRSSYTRSSRSSRSRSRSSSRKGRRSRTPVSDRHRSSSRSVSRSSSERDLSRRKRSRSRSRSESDSPRRSTSREPSPAKRRKERSRSASGERNSAERKDRISGTGDGVVSPNHSFLADKEEKVDYAEAKDGRNLQDESRSPSWSNRSNNGSSEDERSGGDELAKNNQRDVQMDSRSPTPPRSSRADVGESKRSRSRSKETKSKGKKSVRGGAKKSKSKKSTVVAEPVMTRSKAARKKRESESDSAGKRSSKNGYNRSGGSSSGKDSISRSGSESDSAAEHEGRVSVKPKC
uniref:RRM domain-containing protein n=1 Tax=Trichuris muris TaxID=70415 RepID=A0A5S6QW24_TRIMR